MQIGVGFTPFETRSDVVVRIAQRADERGLDFVGVAEGWTYDALIVLAEIALQTSRIQIGSMVVNVLGERPRRSHSARRAFSDVLGVDSCSASAPGVRRLPRVFTVWRGAGPSPG
jgi:hypothetical protein